MSIRTPAIAVLLFALGTAATAGPFEDALRSRWHNTWAVLATEAWSDCEERYTNTRIEGGRVVRDKGTYRFERGELARIVKVNTQRSRIDVLVDLAEPILVPYRHGPFELYDELRCRVELQIAVPRDLVQRKAVDEAAALVESVIEVHRTPAAARDSTGYNGRVVESLPGDYPERLAAYDGWLQETYFQPLQARLVKAALDAVEVLPRVSTSTGYSTGYTRGIESYGRKYRYHDCEDLRDLTYYPGSGRPPAELSDGGKERWRQGFRDGQVQAFNVDLAARIAECLERPPWSR